MTVKDLHSWSLDPQEAVLVQSRLVNLIRLIWDDRTVNRIGGVDLSYTESTARAALVVLRFPELSPVEQVTAEVPVSFPYVPGLLAFREGPAVLAAWEKLENKPDLVMFDGQGIAHPRGIGIAAQMGLWLDLPTIGVAKSPLYGRYSEPGLLAGDSADLFDRRDTDRIIGTVLRSKERTRPLFISPGHMIDVAHAKDFVIRCLAGYRLPEPTRWAHKIAGGESLPFI